jgi:hypothetical protein
MWEDDVRMPPPGYRSAPQRRAAEARRMIVAAGGVGAVLTLCVGGYFMATVHGPAVVPVIQAPSGSVKVKPDDPGGLQLNTQTNTLLENDGTAAGASLAATPEAPDPAALAASANQAPRPAPTGASAPSPHVVPPPNAPSPATAAATPATPAVSVPTVPETPAPSTSQQTAMIIPPPSAGAAAVHNLVQEYNPPIQPAEHGQVRVQLAALDTQEAALHEWEHLMHRMPKLFDGRRPIFVQAHVKGHSFWRVRTAGFVSVTEATKFCHDVHAEGAACTVALF